MVDRQDEKGDLPATCNLACTLSERLGRQHVPSGYHLPTSDQQYPASLLFAQVRSPQLPHHSTARGVTRVRAGTRTVRSQVPQYPDA